MTIHLKLEKRDSSFVLSLRIAEIHISHQVCFCWEVWDADIHVSFMHSDIYQGSLSYE